MRLTYDRDKLRVRRTGRGFVVSSLVGSTSDLVSIKAGGRVTHVGVTVGLAKRLVNRMNSLNGWEASSYPAKADASLAMTTDRHGKADGAIAMRYSIAGATRTRAAY